MMTAKQLLLVDLLKENKDNFNKLKICELSSLFTNSAFITSMMDFIKDQVWLLNKSEQSLVKKTSYTELLKKLFNKELKYFSFLEPFLLQLGENGIKTVRKSAGLIEKSVLDEVLRRVAVEKSEFVKISLKEMIVHFLFEEESQINIDQSLGHQGVQLYRTFDNLDRIFDLNYSLDIGMEIDYSIKERLYETGGVGVQSGYSTILLAFEHISLDKGSRLIDLGSGYGRVGLVYSVLRPDLNIIGYEYVPHRVGVSNNAKELLKLNEKLTFKIQDLSEKSFKIPEAEVYYLYDPFTKETYDYVLNQIVEYSQNKEIIVVTKGNASTWLRDIAKKQSWPNPQVLDEGNLCIFKSRI